MRTLPVALAAALVFASLGCKKSEGPADAGPGAAGAGGPSLGFLKGFEGEIDAFHKDNKPGAQPVPFEVFVKSDKLRFEVPEKLAASSGVNMFGPKAYLIFDSPAKKLYIVSDTQKQVVVVDLNKSGDQFKGLSSRPSPGSPARPASPEGPKTTLTKTGQWDTVAGYKCENWDMKSDHREGTVCVAQEGASWFSIPMTGIPTERAWMAELLDGKHFPLRFVAYEKDGATEESRIEVTKIDKKTLPASEFEYPPAYKVTDLSQILAGLGAMGSGFPMPPFPPPHAKGH